MAAYPSPLLDGRGEENEEEGDGAELKDDDHVEAAPVVRCRPGPASRLPCLLRLLVDADVVRSRLKKPHPPRSGLVPPPPPPPLPRPTTAVDDATGYFRTSRCRRRSSSSSLLRPPPPPPPPAAAAAAAGGGGAGGIGGRSREEGLGDGGRGMIRHWVCRVQEPIRDQGIFQLTCRQAGRQAVLGSSSSSSSSSSKRASFIIMSNINIVSNSAPLFSDFR